MLLISSRSRLFMVRSWEKSEFRSHSLHAIWSPAALFFTRKKRLNKCVRLKKNWIHWIYVRNLHIVCTHMNPMYVSVLVCMCELIAACSIIALYYGIVSILFFFFPTRFFLYHARVRVCGLFVLPCHVRGLRLYSRSTNNGTFSLSRSELNIQLKRRKKTRYDRSIQAFKKEAKKDLKHSINTIR